MRVAIAHDYLTQRGGAERVVLAMSRAFPDAPIYTLFYQPDATYSEFESLDIRPSVLNRIKVLRDNHRLALPILPLASASISIDADVVLASSSGWAHGFRTSAPMVVYCYSPARWLYQTSEYMGLTAPRASRALMYSIRPLLRTWDRRSARHAAQYLAISREVQVRIRNEYGRESIVLPAPNTLHVPNAIRGCDREADSDTAVTQPYYLCVARLLPYKNVDAVVDAFSELGKSLVVVGDGPQAAWLQSRAASNVTFLRHLTDRQMDGLYEHCVGIVAAAYEDFGLSPLEAAAHGKPTIALRWGGYLDTVSENLSGVYFDRPHASDIADAIEMSEKMNWDPRCIESWASRFSEETFRNRLRMVVATSAGIRQ